MALKQIVIESKDSVSRSADKKMFIKMNGQRNFISREEAWEIFENLAIQLRDGENNRR